MRERGSKLHQLPFFQEGIMEHLIQAGELRRVRSLFISDVHLGSRFAQAEAFLAFLDAYQPDFLYIVGDFIDGWSLQRTWRWPTVNTRIVHRLLDWSACGVTIRYAPGNHDAFLRHFLKDFFWLDVADEFIHESADGRRYVVIHGDQFDNVELRAAWLSKLGSVGYDLLLWTDRYLNRLFRRSAARRWHLSARVKSRIKGVVTFLSGFQKRLAEHARARRCHGVICGHTHTPTIVRHGEMTYCNTGDWVENCSALVEFDDGELRLVRFLFDAGTIAHHDMDASPPAANVERAAVTSPPTPVEVHG